MLWASVYFEVSCTDNKLELLRAMTGHLTGILGSRYEIGRRLRDKPRKDAMHVDAQHHRLGLI